MRILLCLLASAAFATAQQQPATPKPYVPTAEELRQIQAKSAELGSLLNKLEHNELYTDAAIYRKAADFILRHPEEFANAGYVQDTLTGLEHAIARAKEL